MSNKSIQPSKVLFRFPTRLCGGLPTDTVPQWWTKEVDVSDDDFPGPKKGTLTFICDTLALFDVGEVDPFNEDDLDNLVDRFVPDFLSWSTRRFDTVYVGIMAFEPCGIYDSIDFDYRSDIVRTRVATPRYYSWSYQLGQQIQNPGGNCPNPDPSHTSLATPCVTVFGPMGRDSGNIVIPVYSICKINDRLVKRFVYYYVFLCGCTPPKPCTCCVCQNVCDGNSYNPGSTITDSNGTHDAIYDFPNGAWYTDWISFNTASNFEKYPPSPGCTKNTGRGLYYYKITCIGTNKLNVDMCIIGYPCDTNDLYFNINVLNSPDYSPPLSSLTQFVFSSSGDISSCDPLTYSASFTGTTPQGSGVPVVSSATFSSDKYTYDPTYLCCMPCPIPEDGLCLKYKNSIHPDMNLPLTYGTGSSSWSTDFFKLIPGSTLNWKWVLQCGGEYNTTLSLFIYGSDFSFSGTIISKSVANFTYVSKDINIIDSTLDCTPYRFEWFPQAVPTYTYGPSPIPYFFGITDLIIEVDLDCNPPPPTVVCLPCSTPASDLKLSYTTVSSSGVVNLVFDAVSSKWTSDCIVYNSKPLRIVMSCPTPGNTKFDFSLSGDTAACDLPTVVTRSITYGSPSDSFYFGNPIPFAVENFDGVISPAIPANWAADTNIVTSPTQSFSAPNSIATNGAQGASVLFAIYQTIDDSSGDCVASCYININNDITQSVSIIGRCSTNSPSAAGKTYYECQLLWNARDGQWVIFINKYIGGAPFQIDALGINTLSGMDWYQMIFTIVGSHLAVQFRRASDGFWLDNAGNFQSNYHDVAQEIDASITGSGYWGICFRSTANGFSYGDNFYLSTYHDNHSCSPLMETVSAIPIGSIGVGFDSPYKFGYRTFTVTPP